MRILLISAISLLICACNSSHTTTIKSPVTFNTNILLTDSPLPELNWDSALSASIQLRPQFSFSDHINAYIALYYPQVWRLYKNEPIQLFQKQKKLQANWMNRTHQQASTLILQTNVVLAPYDSLQQQFPVHPINMQDEYMTYHYKFTRQLAKESPFPDTFYLYVHNLSQLNKLTLEPELANLLLGTRPVTGQQHRLPVDIELDVDQVAGDNGQGLGAMMKRVTFYADENREVPLRIDSFSVVPPNARL